MGEANYGFEAIYRKYYDLIYRYARRAMRGDDMEAEDVAQEVFWVAFQKWNVVENHPNIGGFLMVVAKNKIKKRMLKRSLILYNEEEMLEALADKLDDLDEYSMVDLCAAVEKSLSREELKILLQYYGFGRSVTEMAKRLGVGESCFKVRVMRMREKLKHCIDLVIVVFIFGSCLISR